MKRRVSWLGLLVALVVASSTSSARAQAVEPQLIVERESVRLEKIAPGSRWLVMGYGRELKTPVSVSGYFQWHVLTDGANAGKLELDLAEAPVPLLSVWAAFEIATGRLLAVRPHEALPALSERSVAAGDSVSLSELGAAEALLFVLRPGAGGWVWTGKADRSASTSILLARPEHFVPVAGEQSELLDYRAADRLLAIDQGTLSMTLTRLD